MSFDEILTLWFGKLYQNTSSLSRWMKDKGRKETDMKGHDNLPSCASIVMWFKYDEL